MIATADELNRAGAVLWDSGQRDVAYRRWLEAIYVDPDHVPTLVNLVTALGHRRQHLAALPLARRVVEAAPRDGVQWDRLAAVYMSLDRFDEAQAAVNRALELAPDNPGVWHQAALLAHRRGATPEALRLIDQGLELSPYNRAMKNDRAHMLLAVGDLKKGLPEFEVRWETAMHLAPWDLRLPEWRGEPLAGRRILFHSEQGLGDAIMMARFARDLVASGAGEVGLCVPPELIRLFEYQAWPRVRVVNVIGLSATDWDLQTPMFSALRWLGVQREDISAEPYVVAPPIVMPPLPRGRRIGICWASGRWNVETGMRRRAPLEEFLPFAELPNVRLISLQKGVDSADIARVGAEAFITDAVAGAEDFADTAAVIDQLDAVISVDTSVMHLAAAMGKPTFMLCQFTRCWRWWSLPTGRPWYGCLTSSQQVNPGSWREPLAAARAWLENAR